MLWLFKYLHFYVHERRRTRIEEPDLSIVQYHEEVVGSWFMILTTASSFLCPSPRYWQLAAATLNLWSLDFRCNTCIIDQREAIHPPTCQALQDLFDFPSQLSLSSKLNKQVTCTYCQDAARCTPAADTAARRDCNPAWRKKSWSLTRQYARHYSSSVLLH